MIPFDQYPGGGYQPIGIPTGGDGTSRTGFGPATFSVCGYYCVYCGVDLGKDYRSWLSISVDHVVPLRVPWCDARREWIEDKFNRVTCCRACNDFLQQSADVEEPETVEEFTTIRDRIFRSKCESARERHHVERWWFDANVLARDRAGA